jgi:hypothetical protein
MKKVRKAVFGCGRHAGVWLNAGCAGLACAENGFQGKMK